MPLEINSTVIYIHCDYYIYSSLCTCSYYLESCFFKKLMCLYLADLSHEVLNEIFKESTLPSPDVCVAMMGTKGSGKICLRDTLAGQTFKDTSPTDGADEIEITVKSAVDWSLLTKEEMNSNLQQQVLHEIKHMQLLKKDLKLQKILKLPLQYLPLMRL